MKGLSRLFENVALSFLPCAIAWLIRLLHGSCRFTIIGQEYENAVLSSGNSILYTCWHSAFPAVIYHFRNRNGMLMVSRSRDGEWIARILEYLGFQTARGSPGKGGGVALRQMVSHIKAGNPGGLIADGSQGPAQVAQKGILILARQTKTPLVPVSMAAEPCWRFHSWDRTMLAKPFSRVVMIYGPPVNVPDRATPDQLEQVRKELEDCLNDLSLKAQEILGTGKGVFVEKSC